MRTQSVGRGVRRVHGARAGLAWAAAVRSGRRVGLRALVPYLRPHLPAVITVAALSLIGAAGALAQPLAIRALLDAIGTARPVGGQVALLVALLLGVTLLGSVRSYLLQRTAEGVVLAARERLVGHLLRLPIAVYDRCRTGDLLSRVGADTTLLRTGITSGMLDIVTGVVVVAGSATMMVLLDPLMFVVTSGGLTGLVAVVAMAKRVRGVSEQAQARIGEMTAALERALSAVRTIKACRAEKRETAAVVDSARQAYRAGVRMAGLQALIGPVSTTAFQAAFLLVLGVGGTRLAAGAISVGDLVAFVLFLFLLIMPISQAMGAYTQLQTALGALQRVEDALAWLEEAADDSPAVRGPTRRARVADRLVDAGAFAKTPAIQLDRVSFSYPDGRTILREVSFTVPYGTRTALVGPSGAGKSTLLTLVERFYDVDAGSLRVAGVDVRDQSRDTLRRQLGYVEQEAPVLAGTLRDNLLLTCPDATDAQLREVLDILNLGDLVKRTPLGLDAQVGDGGVLLSGGERQRLAIARTLLAAPPILLLDEPTSNLDARNEAALRRAIDTASTNRTLLLVAHRLSTVIDADQIVLIDRGRVAAVGDHRQLTATNSLYRELATHQLLSLGGA